MPLGLGAAACPLSLPVGKAAGRYCLMIAGLSLFWLLLAAGFADAHTTVLFPLTDKNGRKIVKVIHFHPATGSGLMGIRLGIDDSPKLKGLEEIFLIHRHKKQDLSSQAIPDYYTVRGEKRETYSIPVNRQSGFFKPGDYILVVVHKVHWKKSEGLYRQKVAKLCLNFSGVVTDWPQRVLRGMPEIIPLVQPYSVHAGTLFRAEAVDDEGRPLAHARVEIEYFNYPMGDRELVTTGGSARLDSELAESVVFTSGDGSFSFIPPKKGLWTFTLVDGDDNRLFQGKRFEFDSSLSLLVK